VPTFDNGWICRECWCANREQDARCYRCHADRPSYVAAAQPEPATPAPAAEAERVLVASAVRKPPKRDSARQKTEAGTRFCLTCGRPLLPGAAFCTQCGARAADQPSVEKGRVARAPAAPAVPTASPAAPAAPRLPNLRPQLAMPPVGAWLTAIRASYANYVQRNIVVWELSMAGLALVFVVVSMLADRVEGVLRGAFLMIGWLLTIGFLAEFVSRLAAATDPRAHLRGHWIDLLALVPMLRAARVLALVRLVPMVPGVPHVTEFIARVRQTFQRRGQLWLFLAWLAVMLVCSVFLYGYAGGSSTGAGRLAGGVLLVMGLGLFSALTAALTSVLLAAGRDPATEMSEQLRTLGALREAGLVSSDEYGTRRAAIMSSLTSQERRQTSS